MGTARVTAAALSPGVRVICDDDEVRTVKRSGSGGFRVAVILFTDGHRWEIPCSRKVERLASR
jgi:hypothetical protein